MRHRLIRFAWVLAAAVVAGCASDRIAGPAATIETEVNALKGDVGQFSSQSTAGQATSNSDAATFNEMRTAFDTSTAMLQAQWTISGESANSRTLTQLDALAGASTVASTSAPTLAAAPAAAGGPSAGGPSKPTDPVASLTQVGQILQSLSKPGNTKADFESGASFVVATGQKLKADQAQVASGAAAAHPPAASGASAAAAASAASAAQ